MRSGETGFATRSFQVGSLVCGSAGRFTPPFCPVYDWYVFGLRCVRDITARIDSIHHPTTTSPHRNITARNNYIRYSSTTSPHRNITERNNYIRSTNVNYYGHIEQPFGKPLRWRQTAFHRRKSFKFPVYMPYPSKNEIRRSVFGYIAKKAMHILSIFCHTFCDRKSTVCAGDFTL